MKPVRCTKKGSKSPRARATRTLALNSKPPSVCSRFRRRCVHQFLDSGRDLDQDIALALGSGSHLCRGIMFQGVGMVKGADADRIFADLAQRNHSFSERNVLFEKRVLAKHRKDTFGI